ncbi:MAG: murein hydrolase activator EnvC family protein [Hyphomicrobiaceae bacterium]
MGGTAAMLTMVSLFVWTAPTLAQSVPEAQRRLQETQEQLEARRKAEQALASDVAAMKAERERLNQSLLETAREIQKGEAKLTAIEARQGELEAQELHLRGSLAQRHESILKLLAALQRMGHNPPPAIITRREDALKMVRSAQMIATLFPGMRKQALELAGQLEDLARVMAESKVEGDRLKAETVRLSEAQIRISQLNEVRRLSIAERQSDLDKVRKEAAEIARNVTELSELISRLDKAVAAHTGHDQPAVVAVPPPPPAAPADRQIALAPNPPAGPPAAPAPPKSPPPVAKAPERGAPAIEIAPKGTQMAALDPGRMKPAMPFVQAKGQLQLPAQGRRILAFGDKTQNDSRSKGIVLETRQAAQVTAPADGWVVYAGEFRSFGQLLIVNAGDGYHILLAGLSQIDVQLGEFVLAGQPIGVMTAAPKGYKAKSGDIAPVLYVEFRKDGTPINPDPWWLVEGSKKVQG